MWVKDWTKDIGLVAENSLVINGLVSESAFVLAEIVIIEMC